MAAAERARGNAERPHRLRGNDETYFQKAIPRSRYGHSASPNGLFGRLMLPVRHGKTARFAAPLSIKHLQRCGGLVRGGAKIKVLQGRH